MADSEVARGRHGDCEPRGREDEHVGDAAPVGPVDELEAAGAVRDLKLVCKERNETELQYIRDTGRDSS